MNYFIGVDVGTGSVRAGIFNSYGKQYSVCKKNITTWSYDEVYKEQSSTEIWNNICEVVRSCIKESGIDKKFIKGIGFDATCSLVALDEAGNPVTLSKSENKERNVILWMDHRAEKETKLINATGHSVLDFVGGKVSIEMEIPKILWIKNNLKNSYDKIKYFFDLPDFLVYKATGKIIRSLCSLGCKWNYLNHENKWDDDFIEKIGLSDILKENYEKIGGEVRAIGEKAGTISKEAAEALGVLENVIIGTSMIDAHAGGLGVIGIDDGEKINYNNRLALIGGTSSCHMAVSNEMLKVPGIWGPYYNAMLPGMWLLEGGQSTTGALIDYVIKNHPAYIELIKLAEVSKRDIYEELNQILKNLALEKSVEIDKLTKDVHILPYFIGNRSPRADSNLRGMISGVNMNTSLENLAISYLAIIQAIAYGTRHIIDTMNENGFEINKIFMTGGGTKNLIFMKTHSNVTSCNIILGKEEEAVLLGAAILGAVCSDEYKNINEAMQGMSEIGKIIYPKNNLKKYHENKYKVFKKMYVDYVSYKEIMDNK